MLSTLASVVAAATPGDDIKTVLVKWVTPIVLVVIAVLAIPHIVKGRFMALGSFALVAVVVFILFLHPEILMGLADMFFNQSGAKGWK